MTSIWIYPIKQLKVIQIQRTKNASWNFQAIKTNNRKETISQLRDIAILNRQHEDLPSDDDEDLSNDGEEGMSYGSITLRVLHTPFDEVNTSGYDVNDTQASGHTSNNGNHGHQPVGLISDLGPSRYATRSDNHLGIEGAGSRYHCPGVYNVLSTISCGSSTGDTSTRTYTEKPGDGLAQSEEQQVPTGNSSDYLTMSSHGSNQENSSSYSLTMVRDEEARIIDSSTRPNGPIMMNSGSSISGSSTSGSSTSGSSISGSSTSGIAQCDGYFGAFTGYTSGRKVHKSPCMGEAKPLGGSCPGEITSQSKQKTQQRYRQAKWQTTIPPQSLEESRPDLLRLRNPQSHISTTRDSRAIEKSVQTFCGGEAENEEKTYEDYVYLMKDPDWNPSSTASRDASPDTNLKKKNGKRENARPQEARRHNDGSSGRRTTLAGSEMEGKSKETYELCSIGNSNIWGEIERK
ncbi:hypothetical protein BT63DRAFT_460084 [Microthyrium microscopicum]|uniref:Uncharacterized protein n=1 Tax=Microthyrium microscopicum TaxID=703497 RepID=A0A6A6TXP9_9PEZI|nr:hypothetical protein BT63DRAFT_460084 [Microthyrium microscopicum]